jgi:hypothetical protein
MTAASTLALWKAGSYASGRVQVHRFEKISGCQKHRSSPGKIVFFEIPTPKALKNRPQKSQLSSFFTTYLT